MRPLRYYRLSAFARLRHDGASTAFPIHLPASSAKHWSDDDPDSLTDLASTDESIKDLCLELLKAAGKLQKTERSDPDFFTAPVDSNFISTWRDFEERFAHALLMVRSNAVEAGEAQHFMSFDWYERTEWKDADYRAMGASEAIEAIIGFADSQADTP
jgi:hypothetical protein